MSKQVFYLINRDMKDLFNVVSSGLILDEENFTEVLENINNVKAIVIFAELNWAGSKPSDFYGFDIAYELRTKHKLLSPIIIISLLKKSHFENLARTQMKFKILFARGTGFVTIGKNTDQEINDIIQPLNQFPLSPSVLTDINEMLLNVRGFIIDKLTHDLRAGKSKDEINAIFTEISRYIDEPHISSLKLGKYKSEFIKQINNQDVFNKIKENFILKCNQELLGENIPEGPVYFKRHRIIVLEDDPDFGKKIVQNLTDYFEEIILKDKAQDVIEYIDKDNENSITGIITDWRLYEDYSQKTYWQIQGYEVLRYAARKRFIAMFSLTSVYDRYVNDIRNQLGLEIHLFKKQYLDLEGAVQWQMLGDMVRQNCDTTSEIIASQPTGANWEKLKPEYISKRNFAWIRFENEVAEKATKLFKYYSKAIEKKDFTFLSNLKKIGMPLKGNLKNVLIVRRVYLALFCELSDNEGIWAIETHYLLDHQDYRDDRKRFPPIDDSTIDIRLRSMNAYSLLTKDWWNEIDERLVDQDRKDNLDKEWNKFQQRLKNFKNTLCLEIKQFPNKGILPEEKNWFVNNNVDYNLLSELDYSD